MPEIVGRLRSPRLASAPASPAQGEMYFDTATSKLYWWSGTAWVDATGGGGGGGSAVEYALATGQGAVTACAASTWTLLPVGAVTKSADADTCYRVNADGSISILATGWYTITNQVAVSGAFAASIGVQTAIWYSATDVTNVAGGNIARQEFGSTVVGAVIGNEAITILLPAGSRIGSGVFQRDTVSRNFVCDRFGITRTASGPAGPTGPQGPTGDVSTLPIYTETTLPTTAAEGTLAHLNITAIAAGAVYMVRYTGGVWYVFGAIPMIQSSVPTTLTAATGWRQSTLSLTVPMKGNWLWQASADVTYSVAESVGGIGIATQALAGTGSPTILATMGGPITTRISTVVFPTRLSVNAGDVVSLRANSNASSSITFARAFILATPLYLYGVA